MAIHMQPGDAKGAVTGSAHRPWGELLECDRGMSRTVRSAVGVGTSRESTSACVSEFTLLKPVDPASPAISNYAFAGRATSTSRAPTRAPGRCFAPSS